MTRVAHQFQTLTSAFLLALTFPLIAWGAKATVLASLALRGFVLAVLTVGLWVAVLLVARAIFLAKVAGALAGPLTDPVPPPLELYFASGTRAPLGGRDRGARDDRPEEGLRRAVKHADERAEAWAAPVHGLIWALPALGFLGTAWELRTAVLLAFAPHAAGASKQAIVAELRPVLGGAFEVICLALLLSVVLHVAAAVLTRRELNLHLAMRDALTQYDRDDEGFGEGFDDDDDYDDRGGWSRAR